MCKLNGNQKRSEVSLFAETDFFSLNENFRRKHHTSGWDDDLVHPSLLTTLLLLLDSRVNCFSSDDGVCCRVRLNCNDQVRR